MFPYAANVCRLAHQIVSAMPGPKQVAVDATLGNGHDSDFLAQHFARVTAFEIQATAVSAYLRRAPDNVTVIHASHHCLSDHLREPIDCAVFNLGFLPGSDKRVVTRPETTLPAVDQCLELLRPGGLLILAVYVGHTGGSQEAEAVLQHLEKCDKKTFAVVQHRYLNRGSDAPFLVVVAKSQPG